MKKRLLKSYTFLTPRQRLIIINDVKSKKIKVSVICRQYKISRKTFYVWKNRYEKGNNFESLISQRPKGGRHYRFTPRSLENKLLKLVINKPHLSVHKISKEFNLISHHGIQNILKRNKLARFEQRYIYSKRYQPAYLPIFRLITSFYPIFSRSLRLFRMLLAPFVTIPKIASIKSPVFKYFSATFFTTLIFATYWITIFSKAQSFSQTIGFLFATFALTIGMFFFLYSMKYYLTIALVLGYSRQSRGEEDKEKGTYKGGLQADLSRININSHPFISIHIASYNEKRVIDRLLTAVTSMDYPSYEVILVDDSNDKEAISKVNSWKAHPKLKIIQRKQRTGFKGGALREALRATNPKAEFILIFDSDFIPYPDTITQFLKYFKAVGGWGDSNIGAIQGYQWHVLNKSENWITRGVRSEYAGSYVIERSGTEIYSGLKQISGSVYMIKRNVLDNLGWGTSITEDFELTLKLYEKGYKVVYTPYIQAPSECVSTVKRLIRQRMRWAEGHSHNVKRMFVKLLTSPNLTQSEKFEFLYLSPYYLQSAFFVFGTLSWFVAEVIFKVRLPFWTAVWGWSLVLTNMFSLPLMNMVGMFLEESEEKDYLGLLSFIFLSYILAPFQGYAAIKGFLEKEEGPWFRTPKTGHITDIFERGRFYRWVGGVLGRSVLASQASISHRWTITLPQRSISSSKNHSHIFVRKTLLSSMLILAILLNYLTFFIPGISLGPKAAYAAELEKLKIGEEIELTERRTQNSKLFIQKTGRHTSQFHLTNSIGSLHYQDNQGEWQDLDMTLVYNRDNTKLVNTTNGFSTEFILDAGRGALFSITKADFTADVNIEGITAPLVAEFQSNKDRSTVTYKNLYSNIDGVFTLTNVGIQGKFVLANYVPVQELSLRLQVSEGVTVRLVDGEIQLEKNGKVVGVFARPFMEEATLTKGRRSYFDSGVEYQLEQLDATNFRVRKMINAKGQAWLLDPERQYPVAIDPTLNLQVAAETAGETTWEIDGTTWVPDGEGSNILYTGMWADHCNWGGARFTLTSAIAAGSTVNSSTFEPYSQGNYNFSTGDYLRIFVTDSSDAPAAAAAGNRPSIGIPSGGTTTVYPTALGSGVRWPASGDLSWPASGNYATSTDISSLIQYLVNTYNGLANGANIVVWIVHPTCGIDKEVTWLDAQAGSNYAKLNITYTEPIPENVLFLAPLMLFLPILIRRKQHHKAGAIVN